jgi:ABC-2 type transport system ATP-binding protein
MTETAGLPDNAIEVTGLAKTYRGQGKAAPNEALKSVDLAVPRGSFFGLLGPNGAGKSTLINILAGLVIKSAGRAVVWGHDIDRAPRLARTSIGVVPQELNIDAFFTPREAVEFQAGLYGVRRRDRRSEEILAMLGLADKADVYSRTLSGGMRRRLLVAKAMVHDPPVLVLDEPTAGVDIELRQQLWQHVQNLNRAGTTVVLTTHYLEEAQALCDRIAIIDDGRVVAVDRTEALLAELDWKALSITVAEPLAAVPPGLDKYRAERQPDGGLYLQYRPSQTRIAEVLADLGAAGLTLVDLSTREADLEDVFRKLTGDGAENSDSAAGETTDKTTDPTERRGYEARPWSPLDG